MKKENSLTLDRQVFPTRPGAKRNGIMPRKMTNKEVEVG
jgi:hypothetical protein